MITDVSDYICMVKSFLVLWSFVHVCVFFVFMLMCRSLHGSKSTPVSANDSRLRSSASNTDASGVRSVSTRSRIEGTVCTPLQSISESCQYIRDSSRPTMPTSKSSSFRDTVPLPAAASSFSSSSFSSHAAGGISNGLLTAGKEPHVGPLFVSARSAALPLRGSEEDFHADQETSTTPGHAAVQEPAESTQAEEEQTSLTKVTTSSEVTYKPASQDNQSSVVPEEPPKPEITEEMTPVAIKVQRILAARQERQQRNPRPAGRLACNFSRARVGKGGVTL